MKHPKLLVLAFAVAGLAYTLTAQDGNAPQPNGPGSQQDGAGAPGPDGRGRPGRRRMPPPPLMVALDVNGDGILDEQEIANAVAALKTLDKNGDGQLTPDELRPPLPPEGERGPGRPGFHRHPRNDPGEDQNQGQQLPPPGQ